MTVYCVYVCCFSPGVKRRKKRASVCDESSVLCSSLAPKRFAGKLVIGTSKAVDWPNTKNWPIVSRATSSGTHRAIRRCGTSEWALKWPPNFLDLTNWQTRLLLDLRFQAIWTWWMALLPTTMNWWKKGTVGSLLSLCQVFWLRKKSRLKGDKSSLSCCVPSVSQK